MRIVVLFFCLVLSLPIFSKDFYFKGSIESVLSTQYKMMSDDNNMDEFYPDKEYPHIKSFFILDENGKILQKTIDYEDIDAVYLESTFNSFLSIAENPLEILSSSLEFSLKFVYDDNIETRYLFSPASYSIPDTIKDVYKDEKVVERNVLNSYGEFSEKIKFTYTTVAKPFTNILTAKFYGKSSKLNKTYVFKYDSLNRLIEFSRDEMDTFKLVYDKKGNLVEIYSYSNNDKKKSKQWQILMTYNDKGFLASKHVKLNEEKKYKYEYQYDEKENPIVIKTFVEEEYFGEMSYIPHSIQINAIKYYN